MPFDPGRLEAHQLGLDAVVAANDLLERTARGRLGDPVADASTSIALNTAEGAGKLSIACTRRYDLSALGSATACAAILDACQRVMVVELAVCSQGEELLDATFAMVVRPCKPLQRDGAGAGPGAGAGGGS